MKWPRGRYNGKIIDGIEVRLKISLRWWAWSIYWKRWGKSIHLGPIHLWLDANYDHAPAISAKRMLSREGVPEE